MDAYSVALVCAAIEVAMFAWLMSVAMQQRTQLARAQGRRRG